MKDRTQQARARGYTLVEMLVVIAIILIITPVLYASIDSLYGSHARTIARALATTHATEAIRKVARDVRGAVYAENGSLPIISIASNTFELYTDTDHDGTVERVRYELQGTTLVKGVVKPTSTSSYPIGNEVVTDLLTGVVNSEQGVSIFTYYNATGTVLTLSSEALDVRRVDIELVAEESFWQTTEDVRVRTSASIRNLKDQY